jgi:hypothetical protein
MGLMSAAKDTINSEVSSKVSEFQYDTQVVLFLILQLAFRSIDCRTYFMSAKWE